MTRDRNGKNSLVRYANRDEPAAHVLARAIDAGLPVLGRDPASVRPANPDADYAYLDPQLTTTSPETAARLVPPPPGLGYAGFTPQQRYLFCAWLEDPAAPAFPAFRQLYLAHLEVALLDPADTVRAGWARQELVRLGDAPAWQEDDNLGRVALLGHWLAQDGLALATWLGCGSGFQGVPAGIALGMQAMLQTPLFPEEVTTLAALWQIPCPPVHPDVLVHRLESLAANLGSEPLAYALNQRPETEREPQPWRCAHRDLRFSLPQPDLREPLVPLLKESLVLTTTSAPSALSDAEGARNAGPTQAAELGWHLILEFGQSTSQFFDHVLSSAGRLPGFSQLMDENRRMVYRVIFKKREMRRFWRLWDLVGNWSSTRVYLNGQELEKWKIWPYSQFLR